MTTTAFYMGMVGLNAVKTIENIGEFELSVWSPKTENHVQKAFKNSQKFVDRGMALWDIDPTHGNNNRHYK